MKPREAIKQALQDFVEPRLVRLNFKFLPGSLEFVRTHNEFIQRIQTQLSKWNAEDISASFDISVAVRSKFYVKWHVEQYGERTANDVIASELNVNLKDWKNGSPECAHPERVELEMLYLLEDLLTAAIPFLEQNSDWANAAERLIKKRWFHGKACDFYLIAGNNERAHMCLRKALETWKLQPNRSFFVGEKEGIRLRFKKHFNEIISI